MLLTKLHIPNSNNNTVHRTSLYERLNDSLNRKLTLISAPAGFGKTTLLSEWIAKYKVKTAWFQIDNKDNDIVDFFCYLIASIQTLKSDFGNSILTILKSANTPKPEAVVQLFINECASYNETFILVLDDFHLISNSEISEALSYIIEYLPQNIHLVLITRSDPQLPIAKLRSQNQLVELRSSDLSFTENDISVLFNKKLNSSLSATDISTLANKTEGWIAGLQLAAMSLQNQEDISKFINDFAGNNRYIMDYLIEEVLKVQKPAIEEFLLNTSILKQISAPLCNAILNINNAQEILEELEIKNTFVFPLDSERNWYRYHHLFADLLKQKLSIKDANIAYKLHKNACDWYYKNSFIDLAIEHALEIKDFEKATEIIGNEIESMFKHGLHENILKYGAEIPDKLINSNIEFSLYYGWILLTAGQKEKAETYLTSARKITESNLQSSATDHFKILKGKIAVAQAYANSHDENPEAIFKNCETAMQCLHKDNLYWYSWAWFTYGLGHFIIGELTKSKEAFYKALEFAEQTENIFLINTIVLRLVDNEQQFGNYKLAYKKCTDLLETFNKKGLANLSEYDWSFAGLYANMAITEHMQCNKELAFKNAKTAYELSQKGNDIMLYSLTLMVYSVVLIEYNQFEASEQKRDELANIFKNNTIPPYMQHGLIGLKLYYYIRRDDYDKAIEIAENNGYHPDEEITYVNETGYSSYTKVLLYAHRLNDAEKLLKKLTDIIEAGNRIERLIELKILNATLNHFRNKNEKAINSIKEAINLAAPEELYIYFTHLTKPIIAIVKDALKEIDKTDINNQFINRLNEIWEEDQHKTLSLNATDLSIREIETLKLIAKDLTNQQIADKLFISLNTVKTHLKNINLKLEVENRKSAVTKAKELKII